MGTLIYGVSTWDSTGALELIAVFSTPERAQRFIDAQPDYRRATMSSEALEIDALPEDGRWVRPATS